MNSTIPESEAEDASNSLSPPSNSDRKSDCIENLRMRLFRFGNEVYRQGWGWGRKFSSHAAEEGGREDAESGGEAQGQH